MSDLTSRDATAWNDDRLAADGYPVSWNRSYRGDALTAAWPGQPDSWANSFFGAPDPEEQRA